MFASAGLSTVRVIRRGTVAFACAHMARVWHTTKVPGEAYASDFCCVLPHMVDLAYAVLSPEEADASVFFRHGLVVVRFVFGSDIAPEEAHASGLPVLFDAGP